MAYSANGYEYVDKPISRVKYDLEYDSDTDQYSFKGKAPELIKVQLATAATDVFFDSSNDYEPIVFDSSTLSYNYGDQIFFDVSNNKNLIFLSEALTGDCLTTLDKFVNNPS